MIVTTLEKSDPLQVLVAHHDAASEETNNGKAYSMSLAYIRYQNATNHIQLSDFVDKYRESASREAISVETARVLKRVMKHNPEPEVDTVNQSKNSTVIGLKTPTPKQKLREQNAASTTQSVSLEEIHPQQPTALRQHHTILRLKQVIERTGLSRSTIYNKLNHSSTHYDQSFPKQIKLTSFLTGWLESEISEWIDSRISISRCGKKAD